MRLRQLLHNLTVETSCGNRTLDIVSDRGVYVRELRFSFAEEPARTYMLQVIPEYAATDPERVVALLGAWLKAEPEKQVFSIGAAEFRGFPAVST
jgi:hypothetical protein